MSDAAVLEEKKIQKSGEKYNKEKKVFLIVHY